MKRRNIFLMSAIVSLSAMAAKPQVDVVNPPYWWTGMAQDTLQVMVHGEGIRDAEVSLGDYPGVELIDVTRLESPNYQFLYFVVGDEAQPGKMNLTFSHGKKKTKVTYELKARDRKPEEYVGFDASDVLYLIMPDRFANGNPQNDNVATLKNKTVADRSNHNGRHGGDIKGIQDHLDYIDSLGVTAIFYN